MRKINLFMTLQWIIFIPLILPLAIISGAFDGIKKTYEQIAVDIFNEKEYLS